MAKLNLGKADTPLLFAAPTQGSVEVAVFTSPTGAKLVSNADRTPYSPEDGAQMQRVIAKKATLTASQLKMFVNVGRCSACQSRLLASATMADTIEVSGESFHCPVCTAAVTPDIDLTKLTAALRDEFDGASYDDEDDAADATEENPDPDEDGDDDTAADEDTDDDGADYDDEDEDDDSDDDFDDDEDDSDVDDEDNEVASAAAQLRATARSRGIAVASDDEDEDDEDEDDEAEEARLRLRAKKRRKALAAADDADEDEDAGDDEVVEDDRDETASLKRSKKRRVPGKFGKRRAVASDDEVTDSDDDMGDDEDFSPEESRLIAELSSTVRREYAKHGIALAADERPLAGKRRANASVDGVLDAAKARLRDRAGTVDGNRRVKSAAATAADLDEVDPLDAENDLNVGDRDTAAPGTDGTVVDQVAVDGATPGTEFDEGASTKGKGKKVVAGEDPDATVDVDPNMDGDKDDAVVDGDDSDEVAGDAIVDWRRARPEVVATASGTDKYVFVDGRPVGRLVKERAGSGAIAQWDKPTLVSAFLQVAAAGLAPEEAKALGFVPTSFRVKGDEVFRATLHRASELNTRNAQREVASAVDRHKQSLRTAMLAAVKGVFPDLKNPVRDSLVATLQKCGVHDARTVVDKAFASCVDDLVVGVFAKADELAAKPDAARNEAASFVAQAAYQSRDVDPATGLAARLEAGSKAAVPAAPSFLKQEATASTGTSLSQSDRIRQGLRSIGKR